MRRGEVYSANPSPIQGSEQAGVRPVIVVSRNAINDNSPVVLAAPCTTHRGQRLYLSQVSWMPGTGASGKIPWP